MGKRCMLLCLALGLLSLVLLLSFDYGTAAIGQHLLKGPLEDLLRGDCSLESPSVRPARSIRSPRAPRSPFAMLKALNGLRLSVRVSPFSFERNENVATFTEMGPWVLHMEVRDDVWIMQDPEQSKTTVAQPIHNVNLLALLVVMEAENMAPGIFQNIFQTFPVTFYNMSILERVSDALEKLEIITNIYNITVEGNTLEQIYSFLSRGNGSALAYNGSSLRVAERNISSRSRPVRSLPPISLVPIQYHLPGLRNLTWEYWRSGESAVAGIPVNQFKVKDIWEPTLLCMSKDHILYDIQKKIRGYGVYLQPPESVESQNFAVKWSGEAPFSAILDVYRPLGVPVGGSLTVQVNMHIPRDATDDALHGEITPVGRVTLQLEGLPDEVTVWLVRFMYLRTGIHLLLVWLTFLFFVVGTITFVRLRRKRSQAFNIWLHHDPL